MHGNFEAEKKTFTDTFGAGGDLHVVRAPGRVNLIGEHVDYNDGFVFPMAIEPHVIIVCRKRSDPTVRIASAMFPGQIIEFSLADPIHKGPDHWWGNYPTGMAALLLADGQTGLSGMDALYLNTLPKGSGLSSSAAMEMGTGRALLGLAGREMDSQKLALIGQQVEHQFAGVPCGIMDQTIVAGGRAGTAMLLDCRDLSKRFIPIDANDLRVVIVNSMAEHALSGGEYGERRRQCELGVAHFQKAHPAVKALRDVTMDQVTAAKNDLPDIVFRRCRHVVGEIARTPAMADKLIAKDYYGVGKLMVDSHNSLRDDYEVSVEELDFLVEQSMQVNGVYGARMTGGGFGGCIVALVSPHAVDNLIGHLEPAYHRRFHKKPGIFVTTATDGAKMVE
jgi:galactokinase